MINETDDAGGCRMSRFFFAVSFVRELLTTAKTAKEGFAWRN